MNTVLNAMLVIGEAANHIQRLNVQAEALLKEASELQAENEELHSNVARSQRDCENRELEIGQCLDRLQKAHEERDAILERAKYWEAATTMSQDAFAKREDEHRAEVMQIEKNYETIIDRLEGDVKRLQEELEKMSQCRTVWHNDAWLTIGCMKNAEETLRSIFHGNMEYHDASTRCGEILTSWGCEL